MRIPTNPVLAAMRFSLFSFFYSERLYSNLFLNRETPKSIFCEVVNLQTQFGLLKFVEATTSETPQNIPKKINFFERLKLGRSFFFFDTMKYLRDKNFDIV